MTVVIAILAKPDSLSSVALAKEDGIEPLDRARGVTPVEWVAWIALSPRFSQ